MTANPSADGSTDSTLTDPNTLRDRPDVEFVEKTQTDDEAHFEYHERIDGFAAIGVTDEDGRGLLVNSGHAWMPPYTAVGPGDDWAAVAREAVVDLLGATVELDGVERVRHLDCRLEDTDDHTSIYQVVFRASLAGDAGVDALDRDEADADDLDEDDAPVLGWFGAVPEGIPGGDVEADVRLFVG